MEITIKKMKVALNLGISIILPKNNFKASGSIASCWVIHTIQFSDRTCKGADNHKKMTDTFSLQTGQAGQVTSLAWV